MSLATSAAPVPVRAPATAQLLEPTASDTRASKSGVGVACTAGAAASGPTARGIAGSTAPLPSIGASSSVVVG